MSHRNKSPVPRILNKKMSVVYITRTADPQNGLRTNLGLMLQKQTMVDMTLICSSHSIRVHKAVLAANSFYLEKIITHFRDDIIIVIRDMSFQAMRGLVEYMYCGRTRLDECYLNEMMSAGRYLQVLGISNLRNMEGKPQTEQEDTEEGSPKFELAPEGGASVNRPVIFIRLNEKKDVNPGKVPIVMEINSKNSKTQNNRKDSKPEIKSEETKPNTESVAESTSDVEILRIPFELKNNKPVRNQIKEFIGETMPELILKPRRGRPSVKSIMERSLIKNNGLFQITLDSSDETLRSEEMLSKRTIAKMEKQIYGRDIQQQFVIEQAVSSIVDNDTSNFENDTVLKTITVSPKNLNGNDESVTNSDFTDMNLLIDNDYYTNEVVPQVLSISDIEALQADGNVEYQNLDELTDSNNFSEQNFTILTQDGNNTIEYSYLNNENTEEGDTIIYNTSELVDYEGNAVFANQLTYNLENGYYEQSGVDNQTSDNVSSLQIVQQESENGNISNFIAFGNSEITFENTESLTTNETDNIIYETNTSGFPSITNIYNEVTYASNDMPVLLNTDDSNTQLDTNVNNVELYQHDSDIYNVIKNNEVINTITNDDLINTPLNTENDLLEVLNSDSDLSETLKDNVNTESNNSEIQNNNSFSETTSVTINSKSLKSLSDAPETQNNTMYDMYNRATKLNNEDNTEFSQYACDNTYKLFNTSLLPTIFGNSTILGDMNDYGCGNNSLDDLGLNYNTQNGNYSSEELSEVSFKINLDKTTLSHIDNEKPIVNSLGQYDDFSDFSAEDLFGDIKVKVEKTSEKDEKNSTITENCVQNSADILENITPSNSQNEDVSQNTDIPEALGLLPVRDALEKFQNIREFKPRKTRGTIHSMLGEKSSKRHHLKESHSSENTIKKRKIH